jgi:hypothetical protein
MAYNYFDNEITGEPENGLPKAMWALIALLVAYIALKIILKYYHVI